MCVYIYIDRQTHTHTHTHHCQLAQEDYLKFIIYPTTCISPSICWVLNFNHRPKKKAFLNQKMVQIWSKNYNNLLYVELFVCFLVLLLIYFFFFYFIPASCDGVSFLFSLISLQTETGWFLHRTRSHVISAGLHIYAYG